MAQFCFLLGSAGLWAVYLDGPWVHVEHVAGVAPLWPLLCVHVAPVSSMHAPATQYQPGRAHLGPGTGAIGLLVCWAYRTHLCWPCHWVQAFPSGPHWVQRSCQSSWSALPASRCKFVKLMTDYQSSYPQFISLSPVFLKLSRAFGQFPEFWSGCFGFGPVL